MTRRVLDYMLFMNSKVSCALVHVECLCLVSMHIAHCAVGIGQHGLP